MTREHTAVLIDEGYLGKLSKHFGNGKYLKLDYSKFAKYLSIKAGCWLKEIFLYTAPPFQGSNPTEEEIKLRTGYDKFISAMKSIPEITVRTGRVQKVNGNEYNQKGVDTLVVMDLMELAANKKYKTIILLACDSDFVPIIKKIQDCGVKIVLYYYTDRIRDSSFSMSNEIMQVCSHKMMLNKDFFMRNLQ